MINTIHLFKLVALLVVAYFIYTRTEIKQDDYFGLLVVALLAVLIVMAGRHAWRRNKEDFTIPRVEIDASMESSIREKYWSQINDAIMWTNYGIENVVVEGDLFKKVLLKPGEKFVFAYPNPGVYNFKIKNTMSKLYIYPQDYENPPNWYNQDSTGFTDDYLMYNKIFQS